MLSLFVTLPLGDKLGDFLGFSTQPNSLGNLVSKIIEVILIVAIILALLYILIGGINWITSEGKPEKLEKARNQIVQAITGLVIAVAAFGIWTLVVKQFLGIDITGGIDLINQGV